MKELVLILVYSIATIGFCQDTLYKSMLPNGLESLIIVFSTDTLAIETYEDGTLAARRNLSKSLSPQRYFRYYPDGIVMWQKDIENGRSNGRATYYDKKGKLAAEFRVKNDSITDTVFLSRKHFILLGNMSYSSTVYGGMELEDGTSNVTHTEGAYRDMNFYTVKLDSTAINQQVYKRFTTDYNGDFFLCMEPGEFGFFPSTFPIEKVKRNSATTDDPVNGPSIDGGWNLQFPFIIKAPGLFLLNLRSNYVSYAP